MDGGEVVEDGPSPRHVHVDAVHGIDAQEAPVLLAFAWRADGAAYAVPDSQAETAHLAGRHIHVVRTWQQAVPSKEAEALVDDVENSAGVVEARALRLAFQDPLDQVFLALLGAGLELELAADLAELVDAHLAQVGDVQIIAFAGGLELGGLVVFGYGGTAHDLAGAATAAGTAITRTVALVGGTELGHGWASP